MTTGHAICSKSFLDKQTIININDPLSLFIFIINKPSGFGIMDLQNDNLTLGMIRNCHNDEPSE